jgi:hypothetical protein
MRMERLAAWLFCLVAVVSAVAQERPDLLGRVTGDEGEAVADASVFIYTAGPRVGPGYI